MSHPDPTNATNGSGHYTKPRLDGAQVDRYREQGYLLVNEPVFERAKFQRLAAHFEGMLERWVEDPRMRSPEHMDTPHFMDPALFEWLFDEAVLDLVEPIIGPDIAVFSSHFICKPAETGKRVPWHEDSGYWRGRLEPMEVATVWLAIDPSTPENGCMRVVPGTHRSGAAGFSDYDPVDNPDTQVFANEIKRGQFDASQAVDCVLQPNEASLHNGRLIHGSNPNTGSIRRCGYTMRYMPTTVKHLGRPDGKADGFEVYLARGKDRAGNTYGDPTQPNHAWLEAHKDGFPAGH